MASIVVPYATVQQAFAEDPAAVHETVDQAADDAAQGDSSERARLIAEWHDALAAMEKADQGPTMLSAPRSDLASRVQTLLASRALEEGKVQTVVPSQTVT